MESEVKKFLQKVLTFFESTRKTGWGKNEVKAQIKDLYIEFLEEENVRTSNPGSPSERR